MLENLNILENCEDVYFESSIISALRAPTVLYGIDFIGKGDGACESLRSYIYRLADAHRLSPNIFIKEVLSVYHNKGVGRWAIKCPSISLKTRPDSYHCGQTAFNFISVLSRLTGIDGLESCTFLPISNVIGRNGLIRKYGQFHCPMCLPHKNSDVMLGQLIWQVGCVSACPIHRINLVDSLCGATEKNSIHVGYRKILSGVCSVCGSVGYRCQEKAGEISQASDVEIWRAQQVAELISTFPHARATLSKVKLMLGLKNLIEEKFDGNSAAAAKRAGLHKSLLWGWMSGNYLPSLLKLLDLCMISEVGLVSLLDGVPISCISPMSCVITKTVAKKVRASYKEREHELQQSLFTYPPISLNEVARRLSLNRSTISKQFPELAACVVDRYLKYTNEMISKRQQEYLLHAGEMIRSLDGAGISCSWRNLRKLSKNNLLPQSGLSKAIVILLNKRQINPMQ